MKTLIILRHSKTEKINPAGDHARELTESGRHRATEAGRQILAAVGMPDLLVASDAVRAVQTSDLVATAMQFDGERFVDPAVYGATVDELIETIGQLPNRFERVLLVGHNPGLEELAISFRNEKSIAHLSPAGWIAVKLPIESWRATRAGNGHIEAAGMPDTNV